MTLFWKTCAGVLLALILCLVLARQEKDLSIMLSMAVCCMGAVIAVSYLEPVMAFLHSLTELGNLQDENLSLLLKAVGIGLICEITAMICSDAGNSAMGKTIQLVASGVILWLALPIFTALLDLIRQILGEV